MLTYPFGRMCSTQSKGRELAADTRSHARKALAGFGTTQVVWWQQLVQACLAKSFPLSNGADA
eukprot:6214067-Pleurochrysis_carterae.AAC.3